jgi:hypothetical protein
LNLAPFPALLLCALLISVVFACVCEPTTKQRFFAAIRYFVIFVILSLAIAWLMYPFTR